jgi:hypothetical protein
MKGKVLKVLDDAEILGAITAKWLCYLYTIKEL